MSPKRSEREKNEFFPEDGGREHIRAQCVQFQKGLQIDAKYEVISLVIVISKACRRSPNPSQLTDSPD